ncbi:DUF1330 domain-containing protein, partial [Streptomyces sp. NPDC058964]|uniref:DUF1330 domain-containing protein n=1 Tax=Streptomyces sp. NPDC058964 TaxID=3346681 RepID=UPI0036B6BB54
NHSFLTCLGVCFCLSETGIEEAREWWDSPAYQEIAPLRSRHIEGDIILVPGVPENYDPATTAKAMRESLAAE